MPVIHVLAVDHDSSIGEAIYHLQTEGTLSTEEATRIGESVKTFLASVLGEQLSNEDLVCTINASSRQSLGQDLTLVCVNAFYLGDGRLYNSGSVFANRAKLQAFLQEQSPQIKVEVLEVTLADFACDSLGEVPAYRQRIKAATLSAFDRTTNNLHTYLRTMHEDNKMTTDEIQGHFNRKDNQVVRIQAGQKGFTPEEEAVLKFYIAQDASKLIQFWYQIHTVAANHPKDELIIDFIDDNQKIGETLCDFFQKHPRLLPQNVVFRFHRYDYYSEQRKQPAHKPHVRSIQGSGNINNDPFSVTKKWLAKEEASFPQQGCPYDAIKHLNDDEAFQRMIFSLLLPAARASSSTAALHHQSSPGAAAAAATTTGCRFTQ